MHLLDFSCMAVQLEMTMNGGTHGSVGRAHAKELGYADTTNLYVHGDGWTVVWFELNLVIAHCHFAEQLLLGQSSSTLNDLERKFGALCPQPTTKRDISASRTASSAPSPGVQPIDDLWGTDGVDHIANVHRTPRP